MQNAHETVDKSRGERNRTEVKSMKTIILVPTMYSEVDLREILSAIPKDFSKESGEYWTYLEEKLLGAVGTVDMVCLLWFEKTIDVRARMLVKVLQNRGAKVCRPKDNALAGEVRAWHIMVREGKRGVEEDLLKESTEELNMVLKGMMGPLSDGGVGVVFLDPSFKPILAEDFRVIRMAPFDPEDYVLRHLVRQRLAGRT